MLYTHECRLELESMAVGRAHHCRHTRTRWQIGEYICHIFSFMITETQKQTINAALFFLIKSKAERLCDVCMKHASASIATKQRRDCCSHYTFHVCGGSGHGSEHNFCVLRRHVFYGSSCLCKRYISRKNRIVEMRALIKSAEHEHETALWWPSTIANYTGEMENCQIGSGRKISISTWFLCSSRKFISGAHIIAKKQWFTELSSKF